MQEGIGVTQNNEVQVQNTGHVVVADVGDQGYRKALKRRHMNMIAIGGSIGTGLFLGASGRMEIAGPSLAVVYIVCGIFAFIVVRALGELVMYRPSSGAFVSYAREFMGEKGAFTVGWVDLKLKDQAQRTVLCKDPFRSVDERVKGLIASK